MLRLLLLLLVTLNWHITKGIKMEEPRLVSIEQKIGQMQKDVATIKTDVAVVENTVAPLVTQMRESTRAMIDLTSKLSQLVITNGFMQTAFDELKIITSMNDKRLKVLEEKRAAGRSGDKIREYAVRTVITTIVAAILLTALSATFGADINHAANTRCM